MTRQNPENLSESNQNRPQSIPEWLDKSSLGEYEGIKEGSREFVEDSVYVAGKIFMPETRLANKVWRSNPDIRQQAISIAKERLPLLIDETKATWGTWDVRRAYQRAWRAMGKELVHQALFGTGAENIQLTDEQRAQEDLRRRELLASKFAKRPPEWKVERQEISGAEADLNAQKDKLSDDEFSYLASRILGRRDKLAEAERKLVADTLADFPDADTGDKLASVVIQNANEVIDKFRSRVRLSDEEKRTLNSAHRVLIHVRGLQNLWQMLDADKLESPLAKIREGIMENSGFRDRWQVLVRGTSSKLDTLEETLDDVKAAVTATKAELTKLYAEAGQVIKNEETKTVKKKAA